MLGYRRSFIVMLIVLAGLVMLASEASAHVPRLRVKGCAPLRVRRVEQRGKLVYLSAGDTAWIFSVQPLHMQLDPEPSGPSSMRATANDGGALRVEAQPDGTVRWFTRDKGVERLAICLDAASQPSQWVAFTPSGYYAGSPKAGRMVGWEVSGPDKTLDFFPLDLLSQTFRRDSLVSRVLTSDQPDIMIAATLYGREQLPPADIREILPPIMQVLHPTAEHPAKEKRLQVKVRLRSPSGRPMMVLASSASGAPLSIRVPRAVGSSEQATIVGDSSVGEPAMAPGGPVARLGGNYSEKATVSGYEASFDVTIPAADSIVEVRAQALDREGRPGPMTEPTHLKIRWLGDKATMDKPKVYLLAVGVGTYRDPGLSLEYPAKDATDFVAAFRAQQGKSYEKVEAVMLKDHEATRQRILAELGRFEQLSLGENDLAVVFLAGHGDGNDETKRYHFLPYDAVLASPERTMIEARELQRILSKRQGGRLLFFIDTCHSGSVVTSPGSLTELADEIAHDANIVVFTSSTGGQVSREWRRWGNGAFTKAVVEGLKGDADREGTGRVTVSQLDYFVSERVKELTQEQQTPTTVKPSSVPDFDIANVYVPPWRRRWVLWTGGSLVFGAVASTIIGISLQVRPNYDRGNTGWLVEP